MLLMNHEFHENLNFKNNNTFTVHVLHFNMEVVGSSILLNTSIYYFCQIYFYSFRYVLLSRLPAIWKRNPDFPKIAPWRKTDIKNIFL